MHSVARFPRLRGCYGRATSGDCRVGSRPILLSERPLLLLRKQPVALLKLTGGTLDGSAEITLAEGDQIQGQGRRSQGQGRRSQGQGRRSTPGFETGARQPIDIQWGGQNPAHEALGSALDQRWSSSRSNVACPSRLVIDESGKVLAAVEKGVQLHGTGALKETDPIVAEQALAAYCPDPAEWPGSWRIAPRDVVPGQKPR